MKFPHRKSSLGAVTIATALLLAVGAPAQAAANGWSVVFTKHYGLATNFSGYTTVIAPGTHDAWAFGANDLSGAVPQVPVAEHWNGSAWTASTLPAAASGAPVEAASAVSPSDIWTVTQFGGYILHWNGAWSVATQLPGSGQLTGITALSSTDVWAFGGSGFTAGLGTWHFDGSTWTQQAGIASGLVLGSGLSASNIWAVGTVSSPQDAIVHYNGSAWRQITGSVLAGLQFNDIRAFSATDVWASASSQTDGFTGFVLHFTGSTWAKFKLPWSVSTGHLSADGNGGIWLTAQDSSGRSWAVHRSAAGQWTRTLIGDSATHLFDLALIPGTKSLWGAGAKGTTTGSNAAVWGDGAAAVDGG